MTAKLKKSKITEEQKALAYRYKCAWNHLFGKQPSWKKQMMIDDPQGTDRVHKEFTHEVAKLAESNRTIPDCTND
jgi:hypothetical protein